MAFQLIKKRSTGWYDLSSFAPDRLSGRLLAKKKDGNAIVVFDELVLDLEGQASFTRLPSELFPFFRVREPWCEGATGGPRGTINISPAGYFNAYNVASGVTMGGRFEWELLHPDRTEMPGVKL